MRDREDIEGAAEDEHDDVRDLLRELVGEVQGGTAPKEASHGEV